MKRYFLLFLLIMLPVSKCFSSFLVGIPFHYSISKIEINNYENQFYTRNYNINIQTPSLGIYLQKHIAALNGGIYLSTDISRSTYSDPQKIVIKSPLYCYSSDCDLALYYMKMLYSYLSFDAEVSLSAYTIGQWLYNEAEANDLSNNPFENNEWFYSLNVPLSLRAIIGNRASFYFGINNHFYSKSKKESDRFKTYLPSVFTSFSFFLSNRIRISATASTNLRSYKSLSNQQFLYKGQAFSFGITYCITD